MMGLRKGALQLSVGMIVILIISIVILGFGLTFARNIYTDASEAVLHADQRTQEQIFDLLDRGGQVVNPLNKQDGERGKTTIFNIGVRNLLDNPEGYKGLQGGNRFSVRIVPSLVPAGYNTNAARDWIVIAGRPSWVDWAAPTYEMIDYIPNNDRDIFTFGIAVDRKGIPGTYVFNAEVFYALPGDTAPTRSYGPIQKFYVTLAK